MRAVAPGRAKGETILLVDDAVELLETTRDVLTSMGYRLLTAADGEEGIAMFRQNAADIDLVITDVIMPRVGGMELYRAVREVDRQMPVIFTTGYDKNHVLDTDEGEQQTRVVIKPFNFDELSHSIQSLIGS